MKLSILFFLLITCFTAFAQKAFEFEHYQGKTKDFMINLSLANGYLLGSEIIRTDLKTLKKVKYLASDYRQKNLSFLPDPHDKNVRIRKRDNFKLYGLDEEQAMPAKVKGVYGIDLKTYRIVLYKSTVNY